MKINNFTSISIFFLFLINGIIASECGDRSCETDFGQENCQTCPSDCYCYPNQICNPSDRWANGYGCVAQVQCGDGNCWVSEDCNSCPADCGQCENTVECGDGICESSKGESCASCSYDCGCRNNYQCSPGTRGADSYGCVYVQKQDPCGDGYCDFSDGESCYSCQYDCSCNYGYFCMPSSPYSNEFGCVVEQQEPSYECGNGYCEQGETTANCPYDCSLCGNGYCEPGETSSNCPNDCSSCGNGYCDSGENSNNCPSDCKAECNYNNICEAWESQNNCPNDCIEICNNGQDDDHDALIDCKDKDCFAQENCKSKFQVYILNGQDAKPLKDIVMHLYIKDAKTSFQKVATAYTDSVGQAVFDIDMSSFEQPAYAFVNVEFRDKDGIFELYFDYNNQNIPVIVPSPVIDLPAQEPMIIVMKPGASGIDSSNMDSNMYKVLDDISLIYYNMKIVSDFFKNDIGHSFDKSKLPVKVRTFRSDPNSCEACYRPSTHEIDFDVKTSYMTDKSKPENREWHEFTHHVMEDMYNGFPGRYSNEKNHGGFRNERSLDSYTEAFAEFWPSIIGGDNIYSYFYPLQSPTKAWESFGTNEELAILSTMWQVNNLITGDYHQTWAMIEREKPETAQDYYNMLVKYYPDNKQAIDEIFISHGLFKDTLEGNSKYDPGEPFWDTRIDGDSRKNNKWDPTEVFIDLGIPANAKSGVLPYQEYTPGTDMIGTASNYKRPEREKRPLYEFNFVKLNALDQNKTLVQDVSYRVTYIQSGICSTPQLSYIAEMKGDLIYLFFPTDLETCQITVEIVPQNRQTVETLRITDKEKIAAMLNPINGDYIMEKNIIVGPEVYFCNNDGICDFGEDENPCSDCIYNEPVTFNQITRARSIPRVGNEGGISTSFDTTPIQMENTNNSCAGPAMVLVFIGAGTLFFVNGKNNEISI